MVTAVTAWQCAQLGRGSACPRPGCRRRREIEPAMVCRRGPVGVRTVDSRLAVFRGCTRFAVCGEFRMGGRIHARPAWPFGRPGHSIPSDFQIILFVLDPCPFHSILLPRSRHGRSIHPVIENEWSGHLSRCASGLGCATRLVAQLSPSSPRSPRSCIGTWPRPSIITCTG